MEFTRSPKKRRRSREHLLNTSPRKRNKINRNAIICNRLKRRTKVPITYKYPRLNDIHTTTLMKERENVEYKNEKLHSDYKYKAGELQNQKQSLMHNSSVEILEENDYLETNRGSFSDEEIDECDDIMDNYDFQFQETQERIEDIGKTPKKLKPIISQIEIKDTPKKNQNIELNKVSNPLPVDKNEYLFEKKNYKEIIETQISEEKMDIQKIEKKEHPKRKKDKKEGIPVSLVIYSKEKQLLFRFFVYLVYSLICSFLIFKTFRFLKNN